MPGHKRTKAREEPRVSVSKAMGSGNQNELSLHYDAPGMCSQESYRKNLQGPKHFIEQHDKVNWPPTLSVPQSHLQIKMALWVPVTVACTPEKSSLLNGSKRL